MRLRPRDMPAATGPVLELHDTQDSEIAPGAWVRRALPQRSRRTVGAWCFCDHFGPSPAKDFEVGVHPHAGLSTVTWLFEGGLLHRDSLGTEQPIRPGQLNWMRAGHGISHSESLLPGAGQCIWGVQLWVALPQAHREDPPAFFHHGALPTLSLPGLDAQVFVGELGSVSSPAQTRSPLVGAELRLSGGGVLPLETTHEHALLPLDAPIEVDGVQAQANQLLYLGTGRAQVEVKGRGRCLLLGGAPLGEALLMWWNFVGRRHEDIAAMHAAWQGQDGRFGAEAEGWIPAPPLP